MSGEMVFIDKAGKCVRGDGSPLVVDPLDLPRSECTCASCVDACKARPGWFLPYQIPAIEEHFGAPLRDLMGKHFCLDWWVGNPDDGGDIYALCPQVDGRTSRLYPSWPSGHDRCVFLKDDRCAIHSVKPYECCVDLHTPEFKRINAHKAVAMAWKDTDVLREVKP